tara:strand:- start:4 stop:501 length:498 start_codon:yes stop_codon:yes gene_type:complete
MRSDKLNSNSNAFDASVGGFEFINETKSLTQDDSGKVFALNSTSAVVVTLPTDSNCSVGCHYKFIVQTTNDNAYTISTGDSADSGGDDFVGGVILASTTAGFGHAVVPAADDCNIILDGNLADTGGEKGSWVEVMKITADEWMVSGCIYSDDADTDGTALFTDTD